MGSAILLDKSSLQALSGDELDFLYRYFTVNIAPVLILEILGDLLKPDKEGALSGREITQLANKLLQMSSAVNAHYRILLVNSLVGQQITMDGRTLVPASKLLHEPDGKRGVMIEESLEEKAIHRWRIGNFSEAEAILSQRWRESTTQIDLKEIGAKFSLLTIALPKTQNFVELVDVLDNLLLESTLQIEILKLLIILFGVHPQTASGIFHRWEAKTHSSVKEFAPYAFHCFRVTLAFYLGISRNHLGARSTNSVDLEYVYYLPFAHVFSSRDRFHKTFVPPFLREDQSFVDGDELKADLKAIVEEWSQLEDPQKEQWLKSNGQRPPDRERSITAGLWRKLLDSKGTKSVVDRIKRIQHQDALVQPTSGKDLDDADIDFIVHERRITGDDPCPCGSGKRFKDCHLEKIRQADSNSVNAS